MFWFLAYFSKRILLVLICQNFIVCQRRKVIRKENLTTHQLKIDKILFKKLKFQLQQDKYRILFTMTNVKLIFFIS